MKNLLIGAAIVALAAGPLCAQGNGHGKGPSGGHGNAAHGPAMQGPAAHGPAMNGPSMKGAPAHGAAHGHSGQAPGSMASAMDASAPRHGKAGEPAHGNGKGGAKANRAGARNPGDHGRSAMAHPGHAGPAALSPGKGNGRAERAAVGPGAGVKVLPDGRHYYAARGARETLDFAAARPGLISGCPPGLDKKNNGCLPPGLAKQRVYQPDWWGFRGIAGGPYAYADGYLLRLNGNTVAGYVPLLGGALSPGNIWPSSYAPLAVPPYYVDYYGLGPPGGYRYADNVLYRVDPTTAAITSIAGLLTGDNFQIGAPIPAGYDVYNVPYPYRAQYVDGPGARYRYSDGYIYQVDPATQLVTAAIDMLAS